MKNNQVKSTKTPIRESITIYSIFKGIVISYLITIPLFCIFALVLTNTDFPEKLISTVVVITTIISIITAGSASTTGLKSKGWLNGSLVGFIYILILYLLSSLIFESFLIDRYVITMLVIGVLTGAIGGIIGINVKKSSRLQTKTLKS